MTTQCNWTDLPDENSSSFSTPHRCPNTAVWKDRCQIHGGRFPSTEKLMGLIANLTEWGDQLLVVNMKFMETVYRVSKNDERVVPRWSLSTTMCGSGLAVSAHDEKFETALWLLALEIENQLSHAVDIYSTGVRTVGLKLAKFLEE